MIFREIHTDKKSVSFKQSRKRRKVIAPGRRRQTWKMLPNGNLELGKSGVLGAVQPILL